MGFTSIKANALKFLSSYEKGTLLKVPIIVVCEKNEVNYSKGLGLSFRKRL